MKKLIFLLCLSAIAIAGFGTIRAWHSFTLGAAPSQYTKYDTVTNTGVDSFGTDSNPYRNSVGFQIEAEKISGNPALSYVILWGSKSATQDGPYSVIATDTIRNTGGTQTFNHDMGPCGVGNPYRWYLLTAQGAGTAVWRYRATYFIR